MPKITLQNESPPVEIDLKEPRLAAFLAWLVPGLGHLYQGRRVKGLVFMVSILTTFFFGLWLGHGRVVYAEWRPSDRHPPFFCQIGAGAVALPALVQYFRVWKTGDYENPLWNGLMAPPVPASAHDNGELAEWYYEWGRDFELATVYTMVAGLLNVLAIFDAFAGPMQMPGDDKKKKLETTPPVTASSPGS